MLLSHEAILLPWMLPSHFAGPRCARLCLLATMPHSGGGYEFHEDHPADVPSIPAAKVEFAASMDVVVDNKNYWGIELDYVKITAKYKNVVLAVGELKDGITVKSAEVSRFNVKMKQDASAETAAEAAVSAPYFAADCAVPNAGKKWPMTMFIGVHALSRIVQAKFSTTFQVPCTGAVGAAASTMSPASNEDESKCLIPGS